MLPDHGEAACTECGSTTQRLLPPRFPHVCSTCLFPSQAKASAMLSDLYARLPRTTTTTPNGWQDGD